MNKNNLLPFNQVHVVEVELAARIGLDESIFLRHLYHLTKLPDKKKNPLKSKDGHEWVYHTYEGWKEQFPYWTVSHIKVIVKKLKSENLIRVERNARSRRDQTNYYSVNYDRVNEIARELVDKPGMSINRSAGAGSQISIDKSDGGAVDPVDALKVSSSNSQFLADGEASNPLMLIHKESTKETTKDSITQDGLGAVVSFCNDSRSEQSESGSGCADESTKLIYDQNKNDLMPISPLSFKALDATGRTRFKNQKELDRWKAIEESTAAFKGNADNFYPLEYVNDLISWAKTKNAAHMHQTGTSTRRVPFPGLLAAIEKEANRVDWISKHYPIFMHHLRENRDYSDLSDDFVPATDAFMAKMESVEQERDRLRTYYQGYAYEDMGDDNDDIHKNYLDD